ncbi:methyltransferase domain-containing protein [Streptomyces violaceusniger]|uniref:methyltransferase domain-containing protein n=1 Tax=Streptomyces violaceusniger TaxID=68280 RepID=UPI003821EA9C
MTSTLVQRHRPHPSSSRTTDAHARTRDWAEIQERMLVPLYEAVYERLDVGAGTRLLGLGCGSGLALLMAAARGATVCGVDTDERRLDLARRRLTAVGAPGGPALPARLGLGGPESPCVREAAAESAFTVVTAFEPLSAPGGIGPGAEVSAAASALAAATARTERGGAVVLAGWGPPERCATSGVLRVGARLADPMGSPGHHREAEAPPAARWWPCGRDDLEELAAPAGLRPDGSGRVACPFGYADMDSAVRGLLSTGLFDAAERVTDPIQIRKEITEALHPHQRADGTVWMPNVFRYLICRV